jgi:hypothetical protein
MGDFLEKAPGVDVSEDTIFSSKTQVDFFLTSLYQYGIHSNLGYSRINPVTNNSMTLLSGATDESETIADWYSTQEWNKATINPAAPDDPRFNYRWIAIRKTIIMLDRVDEVVVKDPTMTPEYARQLKAEAKFIRALNYFEMLKRYGGVPIIDRRIGLDENLKIPRNSLADVVDFILKDCNEAIPDLPFEQAPNLKGRATKLTVMALRAKTLLYAASPLFNTATPPLDFADKELICYGNYDPNRWRAAATAIKAVLDTAAISNCYLIITQGTDRNYKYTWDIYDNPEIIFAEKANKDCNRWEWPWSAIAPYSIYPGSTGGTSGISPTLNFVRKYEDKSGHTVDWSGGDDLQAKMASLDPRFAQTIAYNLSRWNAEFPQVQIYQGGRDAQFCYGGFWLHKLYPETLTKDGGIWAYKPNSTLFQLNEFYLAYAEALNEINNGPTAEAYQYINDIRARSGMPNIPAGLGYDDFKKRVQKERAVELAFDDHRFWDIRRWMIAEQDGVMRGDMWGIKIYPIVGNATEYRYEPYVFETRSFDKKMYLHPFSTGEINKGYLIQNPGY